MGRPLIPEEVAAEIMLRHHRTCCVCNVPGKRVQVHHIDDNNTNNDQANLAVLCFDCHDETQIRGGFGRQLRAAEVTKYRDDWVRRIAERKAEADRLIVSKMAAVPEEKPELPLLDLEWRPPSEVPLLALVHALPAIRKAAYEQVSHLTAGSTIEMKQASWIVTDILEQAWVRLAQWYPPNHFGKSAAQFISEYLVM